MMLSAPALAISKQAVPALMHAKSANIELISSHLQRYLVSEKLDGVRAFWNGRYFLTRQGHKIITPTWFTKGFPSTPLDGELWIERGKFELVSAIVRKQRPIDSQWRKVKFMVFDSPMDEVPFQERLERIQFSISFLAIPWLKVVQHHHFNNFQQLQQFYQQQLDNGAEGLMLNDLSAQYQPGRQSTVLKLKPFYDDEAVVIGHFPGKGKYQGKIGSILVRNRQGVEFKIGSGLSDKQRIAPPAIGDIITYKYFGFTNKGTPRFATFMRMRSDMTQRDFLSQ